ncbi:MAG: MFS transporter, partial [Sinobacteraceae bacterium]|nr:MFS transporter [Nevskiaceae bacterium]
MGSAALEVAKRQFSSTLVRWYVLILTCLIYMINIADRYVVSTVLEPIRIELHLNDKGAAFLTGVPLGLFYVTLGIPISWLADRSNRRNILGVCVLIWSGFTAACGLSRTYLQFLFARIGVGTGEAGGTPTSNALLADYFPAERRPMAFTIFALGAPLGAWLGADVAGAIANAYGWRAAFLALGVPGVLIGALVLLSVREPVRGGLDAVTVEQRASLPESLRFLWRQR